MKVITTLCPKGLMQRVCRAINDTAPSLCSSPWDSKFFSLAHLFYLILDSCFVLHKRFSCWSPAHIPAVSPPAKSILSKFWHSYSFFSHVCLFTQEHQLWHLVTKELKHLRGRYEWEKGKKDWKKWKWKANIYRILGELVSSPFLLRILS